MKEEFTIHMDNLNIKGSQGQTLITYEIRFKIYGYIKENGFDKFMNAVIPVISAPIFALVFLAVIITVPQHMATFFNMQFDLLIPFLLPINFEISTLRTAKSMLYPLISFDIFRSVNIPAPKNLPLRFHDIGLSDKFILNALIPLIITLSAYIFLQFLRLQTAGQLMEGENPSKFKFFFIRAKKFMDVSGLLIVTRTFHTQLLFCSFLYISNYSSSTSNFVSLVLASAVFLYCLIVAVKFFTIFAYEIISAPMKKAEVISLNRERMLLFEFGFAKEPNQIEIKNDKDEYKISRPDNLDDPEERKRFYLSLDFQEVYRIKQQELKNTVVHDYTLYILHFDVKYRLLLTDIRIDVYTNRLYTVCYMYYSILQVIAVICLHKYIVYQIVSIYILDIVYSIYIIYSNMYISKVYTIYMIYYRLSKLCIVSICILLVYDDMYTYISKYYRYIVIDKYILQYILITNYILSILLYIYYTMLYSSTVYNFIFNSKYYKYMCKLYSNDKSNI